MDPGWNIVSRLKLGLGLRLGSRLRLEVVGIHEG